MGLSYDIISEFVKITNDNKEKPKEGTVYATVVSSSGGKYVKIDGSDLLTPMDTTADIEDGERVTLTIKDHKAIVTGNVTSPSASTSKVDKVTETVSSLSDRVGTFELVVADKISTKELEAYKATIEVLIAQKASIENLNATNAEIDKLKAKDAQIENLVADKATISDLQAVNATIENLKAKDVEIENAVIDNLEATTADIRILSSDFAQIKTLVNGNLTSDNILSFNITSEKVTMEDAFIKDAMIDTISAGKINAGKINTNSVSIGSEDGAMTINGSTQQFRDKNGNVRIQIGQDASGDFTFILYGEDGTGQLINQNGITASAIGSGLIVNDMVSDNAAIAGGKLDISSVITEINNDNSTTIKSNKIYLNEQEQSLEVAFNSLKTKVDTIQEVTIDGDLAAVTEQVQSNTTQIAINKESINSLVSEDTVLKKQVSDLNDNIISTEETLTAKYTTLEQNLEGFQTNVADTYATKASVNDVNNNLSKNYSTTTTMNSAIAQKASEITASVASTYATKNEVKTLNDNLEANYSTTEQMESAIAVAKEEIDLSVSSIYETKTESTTKVNKAKADAISAASTDASTKANKAKADAISAASTDATSKVNAAKTELNTAINKKANSADVYTKTETYTKAETDSKIKIAKDAIDLSVSTLQTTVTNHTTQINNKADLSVVNQKIDGIQVGGRNLILNSALKGNKNWINVSIDTTKTYEGCNSIKFTGLNSSYSNYISAKKGDIVTISAKTFIEKNSGNLPLIIIEEYRDNSDERINYQETTVSSTINSWQKYEKTWTIKNSETTRIRVRFYNRQPSFNYWTSQPKLEKGTKATDWSPAPEDIQSSIDTKANITDVYKKTETYTKSETDSKIKVAKDAIDLSVSQTYETKTNVESKVTSTLNSAKSYADTKKTEAINTAASDATNKINNINIGGVNRLIGTDEPKTRNINNPSNYDVWDTYFTPNKQSLKELGFKLGDQITLGFNWNISKNGSNDFVYGNCRAEMAGYKEGTEAIEYIGIIKTPIVTFSSSNTSGRAEATVTLTENKNLNMNTLRIRIDNSVLALTISDVKLEKGNKATSWSPAPEDVDSDITSLESETSSIKQTVTSLQLGTDNINATVKSLSETLTSSNQNLAADIASVQNQVNMAMTADQVKMEIKKELVNGVNKVTTSTGYVFDQNGLSISKSGSEMETKITEDGMKVFKNDEVMLTANNQGVDAKNLHATTYLIIGGNSRMEDFKHGTEKRTAVFWIG